MTSTSPADGATDVGIGTSVIVVFSEVMDGAAISGTTFTLTDGGGAPVAATVTYDGPGQSKTLTPSPALAVLPTYTATVVGGAGGVSRMWRAISWSATSSGRSLRRPFSRLKLP